MSLCDEEIRRLESELEDCEVDIEMYRNKLEDINKLLNHIQYVLTVELESASDVGKLILSSKIELIKTIKKEIKEL
ncbi:hypothetical protein [Methanobrevibacter intestini]|uniref:hypothetical protein n=1 Tax=Methanobrevibacter intestini TaxID=2911853 RepID=UPI003CFFAF9D